MTPAQLQANRSAQNRPTQVSSKTRVTFAGLLKDLIPPPTRPVAATTLQNAPLAHLTYPDELAIKDKALKAFWKYFKLAGQPEPVIGSPKPRHYRTTSKRRAVYKGSILQLLSGDKTPQNKPFVESPLEPKIHGLIYKFLQEKISEQSFKLLATHLNYLIIRGGYSEQAVIFNVDTMNGPIVRKLKIIADHLQNLNTSITSAFIYLDPSKSDYYLEERQPADLLHFKKLFGKGNLSVTHLESRYSYHPTSFSQVNESIVPRMLEIVRQELNPVTSETLIDLYCGYGLFSHHLSSLYKNVLGIDAEGPSIRSAILNSKLNPSSSNINFKAQRITLQSIEDLRPPKSKESIILDPPRKGPSEGVIAALSKRFPQKVLHIFCGVNQIPDSVNQWQTHGYTISRIIPIDMFPGSPNLEVLILFTPGT
nr:class I SAM-dependent RNA methyltransferase [Desulfobulbaceae bacterium]